MPSEAAILRLWMRASYSAALLVALKSSYRTYFSAIEVEGVVQVHDPVLGSLVRWWILNLGPLGNKVCQGL